jgi:TatD DNase family protein
MNLVLVDSHCHLDAPEFEYDRDEVLERGRAAGVHWFVTVGAGRGKESAPDAVALAHTHPDVVACVGIHPQDSLCATAVVLAAIAALARDERVVAVGETGLDYRSGYAPPHVQCEAFRGLVQIARDVHKPIVVHTRGAAQETLAVLREEGARDVGGVIHSFAGDLGFARAALDMGFDLSLSPFPILQGGANVRAAARLVPIDRLLIETGAPSHAPPPHGGGRNEPAYLALIAPFYAELMGVPLEDLCARSSANAARRFGLSRMS